MVEKPFFKVGTFWGQGGHPSGPLCFLVHRVYFSAGTCCWHPHLPGPWDRCPYTLVFSGSTQGSPLLPVISAAPERQLLNPHLRQVTHTRAPCCSPLSVFLRLASGLRFQLMPLDQSGSKESGGPPPRQRLTPRSPEVASGPSHWPEPGPLPTSCLLLTQWQTHLWGLQRGWEGACALSSPQIFVGVPLISFLLPPN